MRREAVIGLEVHVQLATRRKLFCGDLARFGALPNTHVCPVCLGLPGALPVLNRRALELALRAALGLGCEVHPASVFVRKNYFYPDLPKGYQITQLERPLATGGWLPLRAAERADDDRDEPARASDGRPSGGLRIRRLHLEEDAGKSLHDRLAGRTAVDLNRAGVPLIEIVTEPDLRSPGEARTALSRLKRLLEYLEVSDCDMEKGSLRVDVNVSVRSSGEAAGTRTEIKNLNSFAAVEHALRYEIRRQSAVLDAGGAVAAETLLWDADAGLARAMRGKEEGQDYRYFPDPDLPPLRVADGEIDAARASLPELPERRQARFRAQYGLPGYDADVLTARRSTADFYEAVVGAGADPKAASNWVMTEALAWANRQGRELAEMAVAPERVAGLLGLVEDGALTARGARRVFARMLETGRAARDIVDDEGLGRVADEGKLRAWARAALAAHPVEARRLADGEEQLLDFFVGQVMRRSRGRADPGRTIAALRREISA